VIVIHTLRNLESVYIEYLAELQKDKPEDEALDFIERQHIARAGGAL
jgi:hypothetical protein